MTRIFTIANQIGLIVMVWLGLSVASVAQTGIFGSETAANLSECGDFPTDMRSYSCHCSPGFNIAPVWGSNPYTVDSLVCAAAVHAGVITLAGGNVLAQAAPGQLTYPPSDRNGISSTIWGEWDKSFMFEADFSDNGTDNNNDRSDIPVIVSPGMPVCSILPTGTNAFTCYCDIGAALIGSAWGSGPYTADSNLCAAAQHDGVAGGNGGHIKVLRIQGLASYRGSSANGITTQDWGSFDSSVVFDRN